MIRRIALSCTVVIAFASTLAAQQESRWEKTIQGFEAQDKQSPPPKDGILFIGSSSIRMWKLENYFKQKDLINRGFGGSEISDSIQFADRILIPYRPRIVVLYAGDNDIAHGKSPATVTADFKTFVKTVHDKLPKTRIVYIAIKPSIKRWSLVEKMREANAAILAATKADDRLAFVDIDKPMLGDDGKPRAELFISDGLHLSDQGYQLWASLVKPHL